MKICMETALYLKEEREKRKISRTYLSKKTKISVNVIEALENGWINQLPERAYLCKMLRKIEEEINLAPNSLDKLIPNKSSKGKKNYNSSSFLDSNRIFLKPFSIIIYLICMLTSIFLINKYHLSLSKSNVKTINPLILNTDK